MKKTKAFPLLLAMILAVSPMMVRAEDAPIDQPVNPDQPIGPDQPGKPDPEELTIEFPMCGFWGQVHRLSFKEKPDTVTEVKACGKVELSAIVNIESFYSAPNAEYEEHGYEAHNDYWCNRKNVNDDEYSLLDFRWKYSRTIKGTSQNNAEGISTEDVVIIASSAETRNTTPEGRKSTVTFRAPAEAGDYKLSVTAGLYDTFASGTAITGQDPKFKSYVYSETTLRVTAASSVESVTVTPDTAELTPGETVDLTASVTPDDAVQTVTWSSSDERVATVTDNGKVTAVGPGTCDITAKSSSDATKSGTAVITVKENEEENKDVPVTKITLDPATAKLNPGQTVELKAKVTPDNATDKTLEWSSSDESVARVDKSGKVTAVGNGQATITATSVSDRSVSATAGITVEEKEEEKEKEKEEEGEKDVPVTKITLDKAGAKLAPGQTVDLNATVTPDNATDKSLKWSSNNTSVAAVENGKVTAVGKGQAVITAASVSSPSVTATAAITVEEKEEEKEEEEEEKDIPVTKVTLAPKTKTLLPGETVKLDATVEPEDATDNDLTWVSDNKKVATVDDNGQVTAIGPGTANITAEAGGKSATATIKVAGMELDTNKLVLKEGTSKVVRGTLVNDKIKSARVTKDKDKVIDKVTVDKSGKKLTIKAKKDKKGEATVKVTSKAGNLETIKVTVQKDPVTTKSVKILNSSGQAKSNFTVRRGKRLTLTIKATPDQVSTGEKAEIGGNTKPKYASAKISNGKLVVKGLKKGKTKITVRVGNAKKKITVNVKNK